jgi:hypothetical protein
MNTNRDGGSSSRIERFHDLVRLSDEEVVASYGEDLTKWLIEFIDAELTGLQPPPVESAEQLVVVLRELQRNKKKWSQELASIVIDSQDAVPAEQTSARLLSFSEQCPWNYLRESARRKLPAA